MKKVFLICLFCLFFSKFDHARPIVMGNIDQIKNRLRIDYLTSIDRLMDAVRIVESGMNDFAVGSSQDVGPLQVTPIRLKDFNQRTGKNYSHKDCFKWEVSKEIFLFYANIYGSTPDKWEMLARRWNRSSKWNDSKGQEYWQKVFNQLNKKQNV